MRQHIKRFWHSAIETAFQYFWTAVITAMVTAVFGIAIALWLYVTSENGAWAFPLMYYIAGIVSGCMVVVGLTILATLIKSRWTRAKIDARFFSTEKGVFDHEVNRDKAQKELLELFEAHTREVSRSTATRVNSTKKFAAARLNPTPALKKKLADDSARSMNKHAVRLERHQAKIKAATDLLIESDRGYIASLERPTTDDGKVWLNSLLSDYSSIREAVQASIRATQDNRDAQFGSKGYSQDLNSAVDRAVHGLDEFIGIQNRAERHWSEVIESIEKLLS